MSKSTIQGITEIYDGGFTNKQGGSKSTVEGITEIYDGGLMNKRGGKRKRKSTKQGAGFGLNLETLGKIASAIPKGLEIGKKLTDEVKARLPKKNLGLAPLSYEKNKEYADKVAKAKAGTGKKRGMGKGKKIISI